MQGDLHSCWVISLLPETDTSSMDSLRPDEGILQNQGLPCVEKQIFYLANICSIP